jgi:hypothetical protein
MLNWNFLQSLVTSRRYEMFVGFASSFTTQFHCNSIHQMLQLPTFPPILKLGSWNAHEVVFPASLTTTCQHVLPEENEKGDIHLIFKEVSDLFFAARKFNNGYVWHRQRRVFELFRVQYTDGDIRVGVELMTNKSRLGTWSDMKEWNTMVFDKHVLSPLHVISQPSVTYAFISSRKKLSVDSWV